MAKGGTQTARLWTYVRDDRPFAGRAPPAALYAFSTDRKVEHPTQHLQGWAGILQADAYGGYNGVYDATRKPAPVVLPSIPSKESHHQTVGSKTWVSTEGRGQVAFGVAPAAGPPIGHACTCECRQSGKLGEAARLGSEAHALRASEGSAFPDPSR